MKDSNRTFWGVVLFVMLTLTAINYAPLLAGKIPFPASIAFSFSPFDRVAPPDVFTPQSDIGDLVTAFYPFRTLAARAVREGSVPLWNPHLLSGTPFLANAQSALFYPPNFLYYVLPVPVAWAIGFPLRLLLAALFTALFLRRIGGSTTGSMVAGIVFGFCGFIVAWQGQAMADSVVWLPLIFFSVVHLHSAPSAKRAALAAFAFAMPVLAGHPETAIHLTMLGTALATYLVLSDGVLNWAFMKFFCVAGLLAIGLAAVQLFATLEWLAYAEHAMLTWPPLPLWTILGLVSRDVLHARNSIGLHIPEHAAYVAMLTFLAAPLAILHPSRRFVLFFVAGAAGAISIVYGFGPLFWVTQHAPVLQIVKHHRLILCIDFSLAVLAGLGISALEALPSQRRRRIGAGVLILLGAAVAITMVLATRELTNIVTSVIAFPRFSIYLLAASAVPMVLKLMGGLTARGRSSKAENRRTNPKDLMNVSGGFVHSCYGQLKRWWFTALTLVVLSVDVLTFAYGSIQFTRPKDVFPSVELFERINREGKPPFRIVQTGYSYGANFEAMYGISSAGGLDIVLARIKRFAADLSVNEMASVSFTSPGILGFKDRRLDMLNAKYIVVSEFDPRHLEFRDQPERFRLVFVTDRTEVYENKLALPAAFLVPATGIEVIPDEARQLDRVKDPAFDPEQSVVLAEAPADTGPAVPDSTRDVPPEVTWISRRTNEFELKVVADQPSVLVVSQIYYPGWKASIDGRPVSVTPANLALSAIHLPPGPHAVRFSFDPWSFKLGLFLTLASLCLTLWLAGIRRRPIASRTMS